MNLRSLAFLPLALISAYAVPAVAAEAEAADAAADAADRRDENEIVVVATRMAGQVEAPQVPIITLNEAEIASYGASSLSDLIAALGPQTGSGRGRGGGHPAILLNGQRISNFREMRNIPPEAIRRMEVLPEEVALRFGFAANQRVINFILRDNFSTRSIDAEYNLPSAGGFAETELEGTFIQFSKTSRLNLNVVSKDASLLTEAERKVVQEAGSVPGVSGDPDPARFRSLSPDSRELSLTASWSGGLGKDGLGGSLAMNGSVTRNDSRSLSGLNLVRLTAPGGATAIRSLPDPLERDSRTTSYAGGAALNRGLGRWQLSATLDASLADSTTRTDRRVDASALVAAAAAGTLAIDGALPGLADPGHDTARSRNVSVNSLVTFSGSLLSLPAGEVSTTIKAGYEHSAIRSTDTRTALGTTKLRREDRYAGANVAIPLASRRNEVLEGLGDLSLNFSLGLADLSDIGGLMDWSAGLTWSPLEKLSLQASYLVNQDPPSLESLGNPLVQTLNVPVYDFTRGETALVTVLGGGNPALVKEKQRDLKLSANWDLPVLKNSSLLVEYFRNRSNNVTASFPLLTPQIEAAFPGRVVRDASGRLVSIDRRAVTLAGTRSERLRWGLNLSGPLGKAQPAAAGGPARGGGMRGAGGMGGGPMGRMMGGGGNGQGRWNLSVTHTIRLAETVLVATGGPALNLLGGDALTGGGAARHGVEFEGGTFYRGIGLRLSGNWDAPTTVKASGAPGTSDLRFGSTFKLKMRMFYQFAPESGAVRDMPFLKGMRVSLDVDNLFNSRQKVTDAGGQTPLSYQKDYLDPRGRFIGIDIRKTF